LATLWLSALITEKDNIESNIADRRMLTYLNFLILISIILIISNIKITPLNQHKIRKSPQRRALSVKSIYL